jgi:peptidoglycan biosynthesis protein MviN/MurJ (putative lipid II flippase)
MAHHFKYLGLASASSGGITAYTLLLFGLLNRKTKNPEAGEIVLFFFKITVASAIAALICFKLTEELQVRIGWHTTLRALAVLVIVSLLGFALTALLAKLFRVREVDSYLTRFRRSNAAGRA